MQGVGAGDEKRNYMNKPLRPCRYPGCNNLTDNSYCSQHKPKEKDRLPSNERGYTYKWVKCRKQYLSSNIWCEECLKEGKHVPAVLVHHIKRIVDGGDIFDKDNLMALCDRCHREKHKKDIFKQKE